MSDLDMSVFDAVEVHGCTVVDDYDGREIIEQTADGVPDFWSVYLHYKSGGLDCIADFRDEHQAKLFADQMARQHGLMRY
ncbi:hypothetical protein [Sinimarinibacterium sp. NLF-5-8]|uniref:hypothetical protein n=1 Tax=Sinimarinibacterium sp. NLF-5-8 TaxID=2698684 RepID=UPI00137C145D|nr:hypothetical protein [Sinimarinibacterium sp. NLF-5-8]QHS09009.1 hypothetical protein GT972_01860 [Sinimarinibacterium sp. NLF-5-8]